MTLIIILLFLSTVSLRAQNAQEIVNRYLDTVSSGDIRNWNKIKSTYLESESYYSQANFDGTVKLLNPPHKPSFNKTYTVWPQRRIDSYSDSTFSKLISSFYFLRDKTVIIMGNIAPIVKPASELDEFNSEFLPLTIWKLLHNSTSIELVGLKKLFLDTFICYEVRMAVKGRVYWFYINSETFLLEYWNGRADNDMSILTKYSDYKKNGNVLIPMFDCLVKDGVTYYWQRTKLIHLNSEVDPNILKYKEQ